MSQVADTDEFIIGDGLLRIVDQVDEIRTLCANFGIRDIVVIQIRTDDEECIKREKGREPRPGDVPVVERLNDFHTHSVPALYAMTSQKGVAHYIISGNSMELDASRFAGGLAAILGMKPIE